MHRMDSVPVSGILAPAPRVLAAGVFIECFALIQKRLVQSGMALGRSHEANGAMSMFVVIPLHQVGHPLPGDGEISKRFQRVWRAIFQRFEQRLGKGIVITDRRSAERGHDAKLLQGSEHGRSFHGAAVIGMQDYLPRLQAFAPNNIL